MQCAVRRGRRRDLLRRKAEHRHPRPPESLGPGQLAQCGAQEQILYDAKPHMGTDVLLTVVQNLRRRVEKLGARSGFKPSSPVWNTETEASRGSLWRDPADGERLPCRH